MEGNQRTRQTPHTLTPSATIISGHDLSYVHQNRSTGPDVRRTVCYGMKRSRDLESSEENGSFPAAQPSHEMVEISPFFFFFGAEIEHLQEEKQQLGQKPRSGSITTVTNTTNTTSTATSATEIYPLFRRECDEKLISFDMIFLFTTRTLMHTDHRGHQAHPQTDVLLMIDAER